MKKLILLALTAVIMTGCDGEKSAPKVDMRVFKKDSCEYLLGIVTIDRHSCFTMTHKGNCRFCAERRRQELQSIVEQLKETE